MLQHILSKLTDATLGILSAVLIMIIVNAIMTEIIVNNGFGSWTAEINYLWPIIMYPLGILMAIRLYFKFAQYQD